MFLSDHDRQYEITEGLMFAFSVLSFICSLTNMTLLKCIWIRSQPTGYSTILWYMALAQMFYDCTYFLSTEVDYDTLSKAIVSWIQHTSGLIVLDELHFIYYLLREDATGSLVVDWMYYNLRFASILANFILLGLIRNRVVHMRSISATQESAAERAIEALSKRMLLYPMMQLIVRLPKAVYEPIYGLHNYKGDTSVNEFILACFTSVTEPSAGIGFLLIFLVMQPGALKQLWSLLTTCRPYRGSPLGELKSAMPKNAQLNRTTNNKYLSDSSAGSGTGICAGAGNAPSHGSSNEEKGIGSDSMSSSGGDDWKGSSSQGSQGSMREMLVLGLAHNESF